MIKVMLHVHVGVTSSAKYETLIYLFVVELFGLILFYCVNASEIIMNSSLTRKTKCQSGATKRKNKEKKSGSLVSKRCFGQISRERDSY